MRVCVTGGTGFIGSQVADALLEKGHTVHEIDDLSTGRRQKVLSGATLFEQDIRSEEFAALVAEHEYDLLVHHAAQMDVRKSVDDPGFDADVNTRGLLNLMEAGIENGLQKVIFASTGGAISGDAIYGEPEYTPQDLDYPLRPVSPYGVAKLASEKYLDSYRQQYGADTVALRYANVYGPRQNPHGEAGVVAIFARQLLTGEQPVVYGDGEQTRNYVYVGDVARANLVALSHQGNGVFNIGAERETSVNKLFETMRASAGVDVSKEHAPAKPGEQQRSVLGVEQSRTTLGWEPQASLEQGLQRTVDWFRENLS